MYDKNELIRIVQKDEELLVDEKQKIMSRAMYICKNKECIEALKKRKSLNKAFPKPVSQEFYQEVLKYAE